jgi:fatty-acyl-CoA synthase
MNDTDARRRNHWVSHIARHAHERPGGVYLRFEGGSVTWAQIHERVSALAAALRERGVRAGDRVAIMMTNRPEFLETMFAANAIGAIVVPVNFRLVPDEIAYILTDSGASLLVVEEATAVAAVIGAPHERWGETPVAVAVLVPGASLTLDELREWGTARLARYKLPTGLYVTDALPRNASGKVMKTALRREYR